VVSVRNIMAKPFGDDSTSGFSLAEYRFLEKESKSFSGLVALREEAVRFGDETAGRSSRAQFVTGDFFRVLGAGSLWPTRETEDHSGKSEGYRRPLGFRPQRGRVAKPRVGRVVCGLPWVGE